MTRAYYREHYALQPGEIKGARAASGRHQMALRSITEVAQMMGISKQAVHQLERRAILKIRRAFVASAVRETLGIA